MMSLRERLGIIVADYEHVYIRAEVKGRWGSHALSELPESVVAAWIRDRILSDYLGDEQRT